MRPAAVALVPTTFEPLVGDEFRLVIGNGQATGIELAAVTPLSPAPASGGQPMGRRPFSLVFRGASDLGLEQRIYALEHAELGHLQLFLVPIGPGEYEAVFN